MIKGLEAIISLRNRLVEKGIKDQFLEELIAIEKELKALEIIKDKIEWNIALNHFINIGYISLEEYDLLNEVLL